MIFMNIVNLHVDPIILFVSVNDFSDPASDCVWL